MGKYIQAHGADFPPFHCRDSKMVPKVWKQYWEKVRAWQKICGCSDLMIAYIIQQTAPPGGDLERILKCYKSDPEDLDPRYEFFLEEL